MPTTPPDQFSSASQGRCPAVLAGLAVGAATYLLFGGRDMRIMIKAGSTGVAAGVASAVLQAALGPTHGGYMPVVAAVAAGAVAG